MRQPIRVTIDPQDGIVTIIDWDRTVVLSGSAAIVAVRETLERLMLAERGEIPPHDPGDTAGHPRSDRIIDYGGGAIV